MATSGLPPTADLLRVDAAERRFLAAIEGIDDEVARRATPLPGWTAGHLLTHVARNADSHVRRAHAAALGDVVEQYPGGPAGRAAEIENGAVRPAVDLVDDVRRSAQGLHAAWERVPPSAWDAITRDVGGRERPLRDLPSRRWQELEVHVVDLGLGVTHRDWSDDFVEAWLPRLRASLADRLPPGARAPNAGALDERDELAWLYGRLTRPDLPTLDSWG